MSTGKFLSLFDEWHLIKLFMQQEEIIQNYHRKYNLLEKSSGNNQGPAMRQGNSDDFQKIQAYEQMQIENAMKNSTWNSLMLLKSKEIVKTKYVFDLTQVAPEEEAEDVGLVQDQPNFEKVQHHD